jgi:hypothetical protein
MTGEPANEFAMPSTRTSTAQQVTELLRQRQTLADLRSAAARNNLDPRTAGLVKSAEAVSNAYMTLAKSVMRSTLRSTSNRAELALAHYGLGLIALSQRNPKAFLGVGPELVRLEAVGRHYMNLLLDEPDVYPGVRGSWVALVHEHETGLGT